MSHFNFLAVCAAVWFSALVLETSETQAPSEAAEKSPHPAFERLKALQGKWAGPAVWEQGGKKDGVDFEVSYQVTSGGKAVLETMLPGTPGEMVTVYHLDGGDLVLVHYCTSGNQPRMKLDSPRDSRELSFRCQGRTNMTEDDHIKGEWSSVEGDVVKWVAEANLTRKR